MKATTLAWAMTAMVILGGTMAQAGPNHDMTPYTGSKGLEKLKGLEGHWEGTTTEMSPDKTPMKVTVDYHVTSGGSAVVETLFAGTPHEMVSIYHDEDGKLAMTHYCMMHNQPHMTLKSSSDSDINLEVSKADKSVDPKSCFMRSVELDLSQPGHVIQKWVSFDGGKQKSTSTFDFTRKT